VANKIGTYNLALAAKIHKIPFYSVGPTSTIDLNTRDGDHIPVEERDADEITTLERIRLAPSRARVFNPAFDVTPHQFISAIITETGVWKAPYIDSLQKAVQDSINEV
jgi:methylthioribose-1-phosphate isomerase